MFGRGIDEINGCNTTFRTTCQSQHYKNMFVSFKGNRFNIIFILGHIVYHHHERINNFLAGHNVATYKLHELTLIFAKKKYIIACYTVFGLILSLPP